ncbi:MAG: hypothetical protein VKJ02_10560 [Snowella sp.]|nr:hypothetical protein [Snowella sp.]
MEKSSRTTLTPEMTHRSPKKWWQRGLIGKWIAKILGLFKKREEISESSLFLHNRAMTDLKVFGKNAQIIDNEKFGNDEFLIFVKIKYLLNKSIGEYADLLPSIRLLQVAIEAKDSFIAIYQTELLYRSSTQQEFYQYTEGLLKSYENIDTFRDNVQVQLAGALSQTKTEEGRIALNGYSKHLDKLSEDALGLKLLSLFKAYQLADYSVLRQISDLIQGLDKYNLQDYKSLVSLVIANYTPFEKLRKIIRVSDRNHNPETYARMVQYIGLNYRHGLSYLKFDELMGVLKRWYRPYQTVIGIRSEHPPHQYKQPPEFSQELIGEEVYLKYVKWLTDKKSGITYVDFDTEEN